MPVFRFAARDRRKSLEGQGFRRMDCAAIVVQNGSSSGDASLLPLRFCSRVLIFTFAAIELCWNRYDSLPVSTMWQ